MTYIVNLNDLYARLAQLVEHSTDTRAVPSSNLGSRTKINLKKCVCIFCYLFSVENDKIHSL